MPLTSIKVPTRALIVADILHGYINDDLPENQTINSLRKFLAKEDPNKLVSRDLLKSFKGKMIKSAKTLSNQGEKLNKLDWGHYRNLSESKLKSLLTPDTPLTTMLSHDDVEVIPPTFPEGTQLTLKYEGLFCQKETRDRNNPFGSDEVHLITSAVTIVDGDNIVRTELHPVGDQNKKYSDVDKGEKRAGPVAAVWSGEETSISLIALLMENDEGDPDHYKDEIRIIVGLAAALSTVIFGVPPFVSAAVGAMATELINWIAGSGDDIIGTTTYLITPESLKLYAINPGTNFSNGNRKIEINQNFTLFHDNSGEYYTMYSVEANMQPIDNPDVFTDPRDIINNNNVNVLSRDGLIF